jgi:hypothetical protein
LKTLTKNQLKEKISPVWFDIILRSEIIEVNSDCIVFVVANNADHAWTMHPSFSFAVMRAVRSYLPEIKKVLFSKDQTLVHVSEYGTIVGMKRL